MFTQPRDFINKIQDLLKTNKQVLNCNTPIKELNGVLVETYQDNFRSNDSGTLKVQKTFKILGLHKNAPIFDIGNYNLIKSLEGYSEYVKIKWLHPNTHFNNNQEQISFANEKFEINYCDPIECCNDIVDTLLNKYTIVIYNNNNLGFLTNPIKTMQTLDVSLNNADLYEGCQIEEVAGRLNLTTPIAEAVNIVGRNVAAMDLKGDAITLTGAMAVWSYLIIFHAVVHRFSKVYYNDGRNEPVLVAAHG
jgi:hypothetical protein